MWKGKSTVAVNLQSPTPLHDETLNGLEELKINDDDQPPELSEEQIRSNTQLQQDELLVLEAIYGESIVTLDRKEDLLPLQIYVHYDVPDGLTISAKLQSFSEKLKIVGKGGEVKKASDDSDEFFYSFKVRYLPPIVLTCLLPQSYPSHKPPHYTLSVQWLDTQKISVLCNMLDNIWSGQQGHEVIYQWVEWLHSSALSYLGFDSELILGTYSVSEFGDRRAISGSLTSEADITKLIGYNENRLHEDFFNSLQQCFICFDDYPGTYFIKLPCKHFFCQKCMETYCTMHVKEGTITNLLCPDTKCGGFVPPYVLKQLLEDDDFNRWESLLLQKTLDSMSDVVYCPRCETACLEDEDHHVQCQKCYFSFCSNCKEPRHVGRKCVSLEEKLEMLQRTMGVSSEEMEVWRLQNQDSTQAKYDPNIKGKNLLMEVLSIREVMRDAKPCPRCKVAISKSEGCNKMICGNCGQFFCYRCNEAINGYDHFRKGCILFPEDEIERPVRPVNQPVVVNHQPEVQPALGHSCPGCGQYSEKINNNNHIFCWSCQNHFCALCRKIVKKSSDHFGPRGCRQHTVDL